MFRKVKKNVADLATEVAVLQLQGAHAVNVGSQPVIQVTQLPLLLRPAHTQIINRRLGVGLQDPDPLVRDTDPHPDPCLF
jgi:hypothetical protein